MPKQADPIAAHELYLFAVNDGELYQQRVLPIIANLARKIVAGKYDAALALKLWRYAADDAAKRYAKQFGGAFNVATRELCAAEMANSYDEAITEQAATLERKA